MTQRDILAEWQRRKKRAAFPPKGQARRARAELSAFVHSLLASDCGMACMGDYAVLDTVGAAALRWLRQAGAVLLFLSGVYVPSLWVYIPPAHGMIIFKTKPDHSLSYESKVVAVFDITKYYKSTCPGGDFIDRVLVEHQWSARNIRAYDPERVVAENRAFPDASLRRSISRPCSDVFRPKMDGEAYFAQESRSPASIVDVDSQDQRFARHRPLIRGVHRDGFRRQDRTFAPNECPYLKCGDDNEQEREGGHGVSMGLRQPLLGTLFKWLSILGALGVQFAGLNRWVDGRRISGGALLVAAILMAAGGIYDVWGAILR